jgi:hypothetical protein
MALMASVYASSPVTDLEDSLAAAAEPAGFTVTSFDKPTAVNLVKYEEIYEVRHDSSLDLTACCNHPQDRASDDPVLVLSGFADWVYPSGPWDAETRRVRMDALFELLCRLATAFEPDYLPLFDTETDGSGVVPTDDSIPDSIRSPPPLGVFSNQVLSDLGGVDRFFEAEPWYVATLDGEQTLLVSAESPWTNGEWRPPTEAEYVLNGQFRTN